MLEADAPATLAAVANAGYQNVEPFEFYNHTAEEFKYLLDAAGLAAPSMHIKLEPLMDDLDKVIADAKTLGVSYVTLDMPPPDWRTEEAAMKLAAILNNAGHAMQQNDLQFGYHNHDFEFTTHFGDRTLYELITSETDPHLVKLQLDLYWTVTAGENPVEIISRYGDRIIMVHVKDRAEDGFFADVGEGTINFAEIFSTQDFRYYVVENDEPGDAISSIQDSFGNLREICY